MVLDGGTAVTVCACGADGWKGIISFCGVRQHTLTDIDSGHRMGRSIGHGLL